MTEPVAAQNPVFELLGLRWDPALLNHIFDLPHDLGGGDFKIESTRRIEKEHIGLGANLDPALRAAIPADLTRRQQALHRQLGYA